MGQTPKPNKVPLFGPKQFKVAPDLSPCICPAGKRLYRNGRHHNLNGFEAIKFTGTRRECTGCALRTRCLRHLHRTPVRQVAIFVRKVIIELQVERMKAKVGSALGGELIGLVQHREARPSGLRHTMNVKSQHTSAAGSSTQANGSSP